VHYFGGYRHFQEKVVHLYTECPEGSCIGVARRDAVNIADLSVMQELVRCAWCFEKVSPLSPPAMAAGRAYRVWMAEEQGD
jgi:hypothetical protein